MSANRNFFVDQSQSHNVYFPDISHRVLQAMHFYGWKLGLKTGLYYLRTRAMAAPTAVTVAPEVQMQVLGPRQRQRPPTSLQLQIR